MSSTPSVDAATAIDQAPFGRAQKRIVFLCALIAMLPASNVRPASQGRARLRHSSVEVLMGSNSIRGGNATRYRYANSAARPSLIVHEWHPWALRPRLTPGVLFNETLENRAVDTGR